MVLAGDAMHGDQILALWEIDRRRDAGAAGTGHETATARVLRRYRDAIVGAPQAARGRCSVVVDCGNGVGSVIAVADARRRSAPR